MSEKLTKDKILSTSVSVGAELSADDVAHILAQFDGFDVLYGIDVSDEAPMFENACDGSCRIARRA